MLQATRRAVAGNPRAAKWDWAEEEHGICRMCADFINGKHPELYILLPDAHRVRWEAALAEGKQPRLVFARGPIGWHIRGLPGNAADAETGEEAEGGSKAADDSPPGAQSKKGSARMPFTLRPFLPFDLPRCRAVATDGTISAAQRGMRPGDWHHAAYGRGGRHGDVPNLPAAADRAPRSGTTTARQHRGAPSPARRHLPELIRRRSCALVLRGIEGAAALPRLQRPQDRRALGRCIGGIARNETDLAMLIRWSPCTACRAGQSKMDAVVRIFASITDAQDCAIELAHHTRKLAPGSTELVAATSAASAIKDAVRAARMLPDDQKDAGRSDPGHDARRISGSTASREQRAAMKAVCAVRQCRAAQHRRGGRGGALGLPGQGTPSPEMTAAEKAADVVFMQLLVRLTMEGRTVSEKSGANYAPHVFSQEREAKFAKLGKRPLAEAMRRLFRAKRIRVELSDRKGREVHRLVVA